MSKHEVKSNDPARAAFIASKAELNALLIRLGNASDANFGSSTDDIHWGHVGSLAEATKRLREITAFLNV